MADAIENLILEQLRHLQAGQDRIERKLNNLARRASHLEAGQISILQFLSTLAATAQQPRTADALSQRQAAPLRLKNPLVYRPEAIAQLSASLGISEPSLRLRIQLLSERLGNPHGTQDHPMSVQLDFVAAHLLGMLESGADTDEPTLN